ncbi:MAG: rod shape-determining protein MreD [Spirochaetes bacterium]|nr:rod shape-determining protein MreD [Spirochaetota bacterium]
MILTYVFTGVIILVSLLIQGHTSFDVLRIAGVKPDLIFIAVVYLSYCFGSFYGEVTAFIGGLLHDAVSNSPLGLLTFPKVAVAFIVGMFGRSLFKSNILTTSLLLFVASLAKGFITLFMCYVFHEASASSILSIILPESFYNALLAPPLFFIFDKIFEGELEKEGYL